MVSILSQVHMQLLQLTIYLSYGCKVIDSLPVENNTMGVMSDCSCIRVWEPIQNHRAYKNHGTLKHFLASDVYESLHENVKMPIH